MGEVSGRPRSNDCWVDTGWEAKYYHGDCTVVTQTLVKMMKGTANLRCYLWWAIFDEGQDHWSMHFRGSSEVIFCPCLMVTSAGATTLWTLATGLFQHKFKCLGKENNLGVASRNLTSSPSSQGAGNGRYPPKIGYLTEKTVIFSMIFFWVFPTTNLHGRNKWIFGLSAVIRWM